MKTSFLELFAGHGDSGEFYRQFNLRFVGGSGPSSMTLELNNITVVEGEGDEGDGRPSGPRRPGKTPHQICILLTLDPFDANRQAD